MDIPILYEDADLVVVAKPSGLLVHPTYRHETDTLVDQLAVGRPMITLVHRLDQLASGVMVVAKTPTVADRLKTQFQNHSITKEYIILVHGKLPRDEGTISFSISRAKHKARMAAVPEGHGRTSRSDYIVQARSPRYTLVKVKTYSGRTHQIRAHFFALGHPVAGDPLYRAKRWKDDAPRLFLHAVTLGFKHPQTEKYMEFHSELPEVLKKYLQKKKVSIRHDSRLEPRA